MFFWGSLILIAYTYFGYPLFIILLARLRGDKKRYPEYFPLVTFLIPAYNEEMHIAKKLKNTLALNYPREKLQIIVAADGSSDKTPEIVKTFVYKGVELNYEPVRNGKMAAIVRAMESTRGEIVVFSDANNMYDIQAIRELVAPFSDPHVGATTGAKLILEDDRDLSSAEGLYWKYESAIKKAESLLGSCISSVGEILAIRREIFSIPKANIINDDQFIVLDVLRRGYRVIYTPLARSYEYVSETAQDEVMRRKRMNAGLYQTISMSRELLPFQRPMLVWQMVSHKYFRGLVPFAFILALLSNLMLVFLNNKSLSFFLLSPPYGWIFIFLQLTFYIMSILGNLLTLKGVFGKIFYLPTFLVNSNIAALAGFHSFLFNKQSHIWQKVRR